MSDPTHPSISHNITFTYTTDLAAGSRFFQDVLELDFVVDQGACHIYRLTETNFIGICDLPDRPSEPVGVTITLVSDDVDGWYRFLADKGVEFVRTPAYSDPLGVYSTLFLSPDGYRIEIQSFDDPDWASGVIDPA